MEASCSAGAWKLAGAGRAVTGFGPSRLLNGPWGWVMVSLLCSRAGVADELAVAHAEAGLEQRVDLGHRQPLFEGFGDLWRERRIGHPALAPPRSFPARSLCHRLLSGHQLSVMTYLFRPMANKGKVWRSLSFFGDLWRGMAKNRGFDGDRHRWTEFAGDGQRWTKIVRDGQSF